MVDGWRAAIVATRGTAANVPGGRAAKEDQLEGGWGRNERRGEGEWGCASSCSVVGMCIRANEIAAMALQMTLQFYQNL